VYSWVTPENLPFLMRIVLGAGLTTVLVALYIAIRIDRTDRDRSYDYESRLLPLEWLLAAFIPSYILCLLISMTFLDEGIPTDFRLLAPVHVALIPLAALAFERLSTFLRSPRLLRIIALTVLATILAVRTVPVLRFVSQAGRRGLEFSCTNRSSALLAIVRNLPTGTRLYSNLSNMTSFLLNRQVWPLERVNCNEYAYVIYYDWGSPPASQSELQMAERSLQPLRTVRDGTLYQLRPQASGSE
jgi:hypothetical protein